MIISGFPKAIDAGLRLADVEGLEPEEQLHYDPRKPFEMMQKLGQARMNILKNGATKEEADFIINGGRRVELNAMTSAQFVEFVERKLEEHGIEKVAPDDETLRAAWGSEDQSRERVHQW